MDKKKQDSKDALDCARMMLLDEIHCATWNKLVKAELFKTGSITFPKNINLWEDFCTIIPIVLKSSSILFIDDSFYHYRRINSLSYTLNITENSVSDIVNAIKRVENFIPKDNVELKRRYLTENWKQNYIY